MADEEKDMQALFELRVKTLQQSEASSRVQQQERIKVNSKSRDGYTKAEIESLPDNTIMYRSVGKAYFIASKSAVVGDLDTRMSAADQDLASLAQQREALEKKMAETEGELRELITSSTSIQRRLGNVKLS